MTRKRIVKCKNPDCPHEILLKFSDWLRDKLPDSNTGYSVTDIDFIVFNWKTKKVMLLEIKTQNAEVTYNQSQFFKLLERWIVYGIDEGWIFYGFHVVRFENTSFEDGTVRLDDKYISENDLKNFLSMEYYQ